jgi:hypothetical protein
MRDRISQFLKNGGFTGVRCVHVVPKELSAMPPMEKGVH